MKDRANHSNHSIIQTNHSNESKTTGYASATFITMPHPDRTRKPPYDSAAAIAQLTAADPKLGKLIARAGPFTMKLAATQSPFEALTEAIIYQQLHGKAAATIHRRMLESFHHICGIGVHPSPQHLLDCPNEQLRQAGLSKNKALALRDLAAKTLDGTVPDLKTIRRMSDEAIIEHLTQVRGIGKWTVEMLLIFRLGRPNVLPVSDYGVRKGFALTFGKLKPTDKVTPMDLPKPDVMYRRSEKVAAVGLCGQLVHVAGLRSGQTRRF